VLQSFKQLFFRQPPKKPALVKIDNDFRQISFTFAVIALSARIACLDGELTQEKYVAFRESFPLKGGMCGKIRSLFALACDNPIPYHHYVTQIKLAFPARQDLFVSLMERLFRIAAAGGQVSSEAAYMLYDVAQRLSVSAADFNKIRHAHSPHEVLGLEKRASPRTLKERYRELMRRYHPDRFSRDELSPEVALLLQLKTSEINEAYRRLSKKAA